MKKQSITNNIKILNNNLEILKEYFPNCFDKNGKFNLEKFKEEIKINEINISKESYGLEWLGKSYARVLTFESTRTLLREDEKWNKKEENKNSGNILIKGDNLEVLKHLVNAYHEQIKMIYIDPPYNTGSDGFVYQDDRKFTVEELAGIDEERAKRILDFVNSKSNSHSAWLTFMYPRLYIAKRLLKDDGVIFVSIDDNEVAQLRMLMDKIFGEENFITQFVWRKKYGGGKGSNYFVDLHEYVLCFAKSLNMLEGFSVPRTKEQKSIFKEKDEYFDERGGYYIRPLKSGLAERNNLVYPIKCPDGSFIKTQWICAENTFKKLKQEGRIVFKKLKNGKYNVYKKFYEKDNGTGVLPESIFYNLAYNQNGKEEIKDIFNIKEGRDIPFKNPKPTKLISHLVQMQSTSKDDLIIDFFAGSGTTGDAVMQLNAEDGGDRKYILVQLPEPIDQKKNKTAYDFVKNGLGEEEPTIFHICKERLVRAAKKIKEEKIDKKIKEREKEIKELEEQLDVGGDNKERIEKIKKEIEELRNQDLGFKIFETIPIWEDYLIDDKKLTDKTTLFDVSKLTEEDLKALLITWKTYDGLPLTKECEEVRLNDYTTYYCGANLYLLHTNWKTENIKALLEEIDKKEKFVVEKVIVFGYNFTSKHLREIEENIRNYSNKKQIEIDTILRF